MTLRLNGDSSGFTEIKAPNAAGDNSITLPTSNGGVNQLLQNGGTAGELQYTSAGEGLHYDSSGRLLVGTSSTSEAACAILQGNSFSTGGGCILKLSRGNATPNNGGDLGNIQFTDSNHGFAANISALRDGGTWASGTSQPTRLQFSTTGDGSSAPTPRIEINQTGALKLLAGCPGIDFSGIQSAAANGSMSSETLDSYEEGTFDPVLKFGGNNVGMIATHHEGVYTKIGRIVHVYIRYTLGAKGTSTGDANFHGLPFAIGDVMSTTAVQGSADIGFVSGTTAHTSLQVHPWEATTTLAVYRKTSSTGGPTYANSGFFTNSFDCRIMVTYMVA